MDRPLPFLDVITKGRIDGFIGHPVYKRPTNTNRYNNASSHRHPLHTSSSLNTSINRAIRISDEDSWNEEKLNLKSTANSNGFEMVEINGGFKKRIS